MFDSNGNKNVNKFFDRIFYIILLASLIIVIAMINNYGTSFDEPILYDYAHFLPSTYIKAAFSQSITGLSDFGDVKYYGPAHLLIGEFASNIFHVFPWMDNYDRWHIYNFTIFLGGTAALYWLMQKFVSKKSAFLSALVYLTQPLLWGHGVMNPKDTPFASFFILSIAVGIKLVDCLKTETINNNPEVVLHRFSLKHWYGYVIWISAVLLFFDRLFDHFITSPIVEKFFSSLLDTTQKFPLREYILERAPQLDHKTIQLYIQKILYQISFIEFFILVVFAIVLMVIFVKNASSGYRLVLISGIVLGITISIRILGPAAGAIVIVYSITQSKFNKLIRPLIFYSITAAFTTYALWPYLWQDPIGRFFESFSIMANFPWGGTVRFAGMDVSANSLPWYYLATLIGIQLTLPVILLSITGTVLSVRKLLRKKMAGLPHLVPLIWFYVPFVAWLVLRPNTYDNFRQFLFIIPPLFIFVALSVEEIWKKIRKPMFRWIFALVLLLPGIIAGSLLHPYEYVYYNAIVGWTANITTNFEADYYATSFCEAAKRMDPIMTDSSKIAFTSRGLSRLFLTCTKKTPQIFIERAEISKIDPDFSVILTRWGDDKDYFRWMTPIEIINIGRTELLVIKEAN